MMFHVLGTAAVEPRPEMTSRTRVAGLRVGTIVFAARLGPTVARQVR